jgi:4-amino-4-deoxy-L-arabinose transferase-like glycosyltransferase
MTIESSFSRRVEAVGLVVILALAAVLRLGWPGLTEFKADEARLLALALDMAQGQGVALRGISSSVGFPNFPMSVWLYALPVWIRPHVYAATLFTGLLNLLAVAAAYWFVRRYWGVKAALAAVLLLAVSPWAVIFSRKIWAQNLLPLLVMGWAIGGTLAFVERRPRFILLHLLCLAIAVQIHLAAAALGVVTAVYLLIFWRRIDWKWLVAGGLVGVMTAVPFFIYLWQNQDKAGLPGGFTTAPGFDYSPFQLAARLSLGTDIHSLAGPDAFADYLARVPDMTAVYLLWGVLIAGGTLLMIYDLRFTINRQSSILRQAQDKFANRQSEAGLMAVLWLLIPPLVFAWNLTPVFVHYFIATLPAQYVAAGVTFDRLARRRAAVAGWVVLAGTAVLQTWVFLSLLFFIGERATPGGFGLPLAYQLAAVKQAQTMLAKTGAGEILVAGPGESPDVDEFPAVYDVLLRDLPHRFVDGNRSALFPAEVAVVLLDGDMAVADLYEETAISHREIPLRTGEGSLHVLALPPAAAPPSDAVFEPPYLLANWVNLLGYDEPVVGDDGTAVWQLYWRTGDNPDPAGYQIFNHLMDGAGRRVSQVDGPAFSPMQWRAGDVVVSRFVLSWPEEGERPYTIRTGMYRYPSLEPVLLLDVAGNPFSDGVTVEIGR